MFCPLVWCLKIPLFYTEGIWEMAIVTYTQECHLRHALLKLAGEVCPVFSDIGPPGRVCRDRPAQLCTVHCLQLKPLCQIFSKLSFSTEPGIGTRLSQLCIPYFLMETLGWIRKSSCFTLNILAYISFSFLISPVSFTGPHMKIHEDGRNRSSSPLL